MSLFDAQIIYKSIDDAGDTVTVNTITRTAASDEWSDVTRTSVGVSATAVVQIVTENDDIVKLGHMMAGDILFFFKSTTTGITRNNTITYQTKEYEIYDIIEHRVGNALYAQEARARRI